MENLKTNDLESINGGRIIKYPNGVYCNTDTGTCNVNWEEGWAAVGRTIVDGWVKYGPWTPRP